MVAMDEEHTEKRPAAEGREEAQDPELRPSFGISSIEYKDGTHSWAALTISGSNEENLGSRFQVKNTGPHWECVCVSI